MRVLIYSMAIWLVASVSHAGEYDYETYRALDNISWDLFLLRLDTQYPSTAPSSSYGYSGGYFPVYTPPRPSKHQIRDYNKRISRMARAASNRAKRGR